MYNLFLGIQFLGIFILFLEFFYLFHQKSSRDQMLLLVFCVCGLVNTIGYTFEMTATTRDTAILAVRFLYIGKVYIPYTMFLFVMDFCKCKLGKRIEQGLFLYHTFTLFAVLTCEQHHLFYTSIEYVEQGLFPHLVLGHGILYNLYIFLMLVYMLAMPTACFFRYKKIKDKSEKRTIVALCFVTIIPLMGLWVFLTGLTQGYDTTAICYPFSSIMLFFLTCRHNILNLADIAKDEMIENLSEGLIVFDNNGDVVYQNTSAKQILEMEQKDTKENQKMLQNWKESNVPKLIGERYFEPKKREVRENGRIDGIMWTLNDVTDNYRYMNKLEEEVERKTREITRIQHKIIKSLAILIGVRDDDTGNHVNRTSGVVGILVRELKKNPKYTEILNDNMIQDIIDAAPLHDIGKIAIPDSILQKPGRLTPEEYEVIKTHSEIGGKMLEEVLDGVEDDQYLSTARAIAYYHHERWDGKGYPVGLGKEQIPLPARIMAVSDVYDALVSARSYKNPMPVKEAYQIIVEGSGTQFDPEVVDAFICRFQDIIELYRRYENR